MSKRLYRVLIADTEDTVTTRLKKFLTEQGFDVRIAGSGESMKKMLLEWYPDFLMIDLLLHDSPGLETLQWIKVNVPTPHVPKVIIMSAHNSAENVRKCLNAGADDYIVKPLKFGDVPNRLLFQAQRKKHWTLEPDEVTGAVNPQSMSLHLAELIVKEAVVPRNTETTLYNMTRMVAMKLKAVRASLVFCNLDQNKGEVLASSDTPEARGIRLDLNQYPEVTHVLATDKVAVIDNLDLNPLLEGIKARVKTISFNSMIVCPVSQFGRPQCVFSIRLQTAFEGLKEEDVRFARLVSHVMGLVLEKDHLQKTLQQIQLKKAA